MSTIYPLIAVEPHCYRIADGETLTSQNVISAALWLTAMKVKRGSGALDTPDCVKDYLLLHLAPEHNEKFWCMYLDNRHRVIQHGTMFHGTVDSASVYPRVIVKEALNCNASAVIFAHNHPSGVAEPSQADIEITRKLTVALKLVDIRVLDHIVVGTETSVSFAERGLI